MPGPAVSGSETSSDEGEPIPQHALHAQYVKASDAEASRSYHVPSEEPKAINDVRLRGPLFNQQRRDYTVKEQRLPIPGAVPEDARAEDNLQSYKCQACPVSMRTVNELQVHCFAEHNIETDSSTNIHGDRSAGKCNRDKEKNTQKRITEESTIQEERSRQRTEDT